MLDALQIFDGSVVPSTGAALTTSRASTNVLDMLAGRDVGAGIAQDLELHVDVMQAFTAAGGATLQIQVQEAPETSLGSGVPGTYYTIAETDALPVASLIVGARVARYSWPVIQLNYPAGDASPPRFLRLNYIVSTGPFTAGTLLAYLSADREEYLNYRANYVVA